MQRAAVLATHLYTPSGSGTPVAVKLGRASSISHVENLTHTLNKVCQEAKQSSEWTLWNMSKESQLRMPANANFPNNNIRLDTEASALSYVSEQPIQIKLEENTTNWSIIDKDKEYSYKEVLNKVDALKDSINDRFNIVYEDGVHQKISGQVYHDLHECAHNNQKELESYFDGLNLDKGSNE